MPIIMVEHYTRDEIRANPSVLVVFGDNMAGVGFGGQAAAARGEPNAVGIQTVWGPGSFFNDTDLGYVSHAIDARFVRLLFHLAHGGTIWWPSAGVGTGLAQLATKAPRIMAYIADWLFVLRQADAER